jgi:hypothetical protein
VDNIADDLIEGIASISEFIGRPQRRTYYLAEKGLIPGVFKQEGRWVGLKSKIREGYARLASGEAVTDAA